MTKINRISKYSYHIINSLCNKPETLVSKSSLLDMNKMSQKNKILLSSQIIHTEIPIRFSKRIKELEELPLELDNNHEIFEIRDWYVKSLDEITSINKPKNIDECHVLKDIISNIHDRHSSTLITMAEGISKLKSKNLINNDTDHFLTKFYHNRTKTRFLISNYLDYYKENDNLIGALNTNCDINSIVKDAIVDINIMADMHRCNIPDIKINVNSNNFIYPINLLYFSILEVLKNSLVAVQDNNNGEINISSYNDENLIVLKISDNGNGIENYNMDNIWNFSFTTSKVDYTNNFYDDFQKENPLCGFGYGLPISRILLRTFNGDIKVYSKKNKGTDTYIFIDLNSNWKL